MSTVVPRMRLADYFVVIELNESQIRNACSAGDITQRFPRDDWPELPLSPSLNIFCCPQGWSLTTELQHPSFFCCTLTDLSGCHQYACCLHILEPYTAALGDGSDYDAATLTNTLATNATIYKPKVYVILSRFAYFDLYRNCLNRIFGALIDGDTSAAESMVACLVSNIYLTSSPNNIFFNLAADKFSVKPLTWPTVPITSSRVATLASQLGTIHNLLSVICCLLRDQKIILISSSVSRLSDAAYALKSLLYPFVYSYTFVSVLPELALECLESPTPYIMGVHSSLRERIECVDSCIVDLDIGSVEDPLKTTLDIIPEPFLSRLVYVLQMILNPGLSTADHAFSTGLPPPLSFDALDKRIRACFLRFFAELLYGYRCCLQLVRLHETPLIVFHKSAFLGMRELNHSEMMHTLLNSLMFQSFISDRGLPYRSVDLFDDIIANLNIDLKDDNDYSGKGPLMDEVISIARKLEDNERQELSPLTAAPLSRKRSLSTSSKFLPSLLPTINADEVSSIIGRNLKNLSDSCMPGPHGAKTFLSGGSKVVPACTTINLMEEQVGASSRRLQVLHLCLKFIFDSKLSDARKILSAVELSMRSVCSRVALCQLLWTNLQPVNRATLHPQQFDLLCRLINCALENESTEDEHGVAYAFLYLSNIYCRRLNAGVLQFLYTCIQDHGVWENEKFWETAFCHDVHQQMRRLYISKSGKNFSHDEDDASRCPFALKNTLGTWSFSDTPTAMQIAADRLEKLDTYSPIEIDQFSCEEQAIVFGQAKHYINLMVYLRVPLDASRLRRVNVGKLERQKGRSSEANSVDSDSVDSDVESGFVESVPNDTDMGLSTVKWISRLIDRICSAAGLPDNQIERLNAEIPGFVGVHIDNLEQVHIESKRISPLHKPKIVQPNLLPDEQILVTGLRAFLLPDGRDQTITGFCDPNTSMLPAEGALFLTNYRVVFKGQPCNPFLCERSVIRSIPIMTVTKDKQISDQLAQNPAQLEGVPSKVAHRLHDALQIRSSAFQLMKVAFDEEVTAEDVDNLMRTLNDLRWPHSQPRTYFAFASVASALYAGSALNQTKGKYDTFRRNWIRNPLKLASEKKKSVNISPFTSSKALHHASSGSSLPTRSATPLSLDDYIEGTPAGCGEFIDLNTLSESKALKIEANSKLEKHYLMDYHRLGLVSERQQRFRISFVNECYELCRSYPGVLIVPQMVSDEHFLKISKGFKMGRFPVITWQNSKGAFLARGSSLNGQTVVSKIKKQANFLGSSGNALEVQNALNGHNGSRASLMSSDAKLQAGASGSSAELQTRYMSVLTHLSPIPSGTSSASLYGSLTSLFSLDTLLTADGVSMVSASTPDMHRKAGTSSELTRHAATKFTRNGGSKHQRSITSSTMAPTTKTSRLSTSLSTRGCANRMSSILNLTRNSLYILGDKVNAKTMKLEKSCEFIPIAYPTAHNAKVAFKKLLRVAVPSWLSSIDGSLSYFKMLDETGWLQMISQLLCISNSIVDIVDLHHSSVALCIEDGWDSSCQLLSLSQLLLDPYYRTIEGFRILVEKEWLAFGYRFMHRSNHTSSSQGSGIAPMFVMFLDAVHQVMTQYPNAFEFNDFYLRFIAFHSMSCHFATFLFDTEMERIHFNEAYTVYSKDHVRPDSIFTYIENKLKQSPIQFYNFNYVASVHNVLRPEVGIAALHVWRWYTEDHLAHGSCYDLDLYEKELGEREEESLENLDNRATIQVKRNLRVLDDAYRCTDLMETNAFVVHLENLGRLQSLVDKVKQNELTDWMSSMKEATEAASKSDELTTHVPNEWNSRVHRALHKKDTVRLLLRGTSYQLSHRARESLPQTNNGHTFLLFATTPSSSCGLCTQSMTGGAPQKSFKCTGCGLIAHEKCSRHITWQCSGKDKPTLPVEQNSPSATVAEEIGKVSATLSDEDQTLSWIPKTKTSYLHSGVLMKKGATFKLWKPRWFVLDDTRHELRYYDSENDHNCKGVIDLAEVKSVDFPTVKRTLNASANMFELRTAKRTYSLLAEAKNDAEEWVEKIESVLRE